MSDEENEEKKEQAETDEFHKKISVANKLDKMKSFLRLPSRLPARDPDWMQKKFRGDKLIAEEIEDYMKWKHEYKLARFKKIIKGVHQGTLLKVHQEVTTKKV